MGLIEIASGKSAWRGLDYYVDHKVISWQKTGQGKYEGIVQGSSGKSYKVKIDTEHPRSSACSCPFASGRRVICKHMIALYFTAEPWAAEHFMNQAELFEKEQEKEKEEQLDKLRQYVESLSKEELQDQLYDALVQLEDRNHYW